MPTPRDGRKTIRELRLVKSLPTAATSNEAVLAAYVAYRKVNGWRPKTAEDRGNQIRRIGHQLPVPFVDLTEEDVLAWHAGLDGLAANSRASYISALKDMYRWMTVYARPRLRIDDPTLILERPRIPQGQPRPMPDRHLDLALACAVSSPEMYLWLGLMGCSGLRCCEIAWLQISGVEHGTAGGLLHVVGKGGSSARCRSARCCC